MTEQKIEKLKEQTAQYAIEHIKGKGLHTGINWLRDSFNELCEVIGANEWKPEDIGFDLNELVKYLKEEPWVAEIAAKPADQRPWEDIERITEDFICKYWLRSPEEVTSKDIADVLKVADPISHRHLVGQRVAIDCIRALDSSQLHRLDDVLRDLEMNPNLGKSNQLSV